MAKDGRVRDGSGLRDHTPMPGPSRRLPVGVAVAVVAAALAAEGLVRCLRRTVRLTFETRWLRELSRTDPLTGLGNRRYVEERLAGAVSGARRHGEALSVLFVDVDGFKRINDELGYAAGDDVLRVVGERLARSMRAEDFIGRWGGEEFVAVLATTDRSGALALAERVRMVVAAEPVGATPRGVNVTVSIGCASGTGTPLELIRRAARALRQAKQAGKNRVVAADPDDGAG